jgi:signal transduction histidine kinase
MSTYQEKIRKFLDFSRKDFITAKNRKIIHYTLLGALIVLQFFLGLTLYNEWVNQSKVNELQKERRFADTVRQLSDKTRSDYLDAQWQLQNFFLKREAAYLDRYFTLMGGVLARMDTLHGMTSQNSRWKELMLKKQQKEQKFLTLKKELDSVMQLYLSDSTFINDTSKTFQPFPVEEVLENVEVETRIKADSVSKKGLFSRLMAAFSGKVEIQKEIVENTVKMKYGKTATSGTVEQQMKRLLEQAAKHYKEQFTQLQNRFYGLKTEDTALMALNEALVNESHLLLEEFNSISNQLYRESEKAEAEQTATVHTIRAFSLFMLIFGLVLLTLFLWMVTRLAFQKEHQLTDANATIQKHLVFKTKIIGMLSHEIRSPLSLIGVFSKHLSKRFSDNETKEVFDSLQYTTHSLLVLVNQVLDFSKRENHRLKLKKTSIDLREELMLLFSALRNLVHESGNTLVIPEELPNTLKANADMVKIQQLFYNLIGNANRFSQKGTIRIAMALQPQGEHYWRMMVEIKDNGKGIPPQDLEKIMDAVVHGKETVRLEEVSTGLGLLLCREIITLYQGSFSISSEVNQGTTVAFSLVIDKEV